MFSSFAHVLFFAVLLAAAEEEVSSQPPPPPLRVRFVNELPNTSIELYWENHDHAAADDDPNNRRRLEAIIHPRGGLHDTSTFVGHGK